MSVAGTSLTGAVLLHPRGDFTGNIRWAGRLSKSDQDELSKALTAIRSLGYWASPFPEGDGVTFDLDDKSVYDPDVALADFRATFPFLNLAALSPAENLPNALSRLAAERYIDCTCLVPVEFLRLDAPATLGRTQLHAPVDGSDNQLADHAWRALCDEAGADANPAWIPGSAARGTTQLLARPLIERKLRIPLSVYYGAKASFDAQSQLLRLIMEDADQALDPIRFECCRFTALEHLPAKPGWIGDTALVYVQPEDRGLDPLFLQGKPYVLRVSNNWLGLEVDPGAIASAEPLSASIVDVSSTGEITLALRSALRAFGRSFYLVELEASFLHLVYAVDALCEPDSLRGDQHRLWIAAFGSRGLPSRLAEILDDFPRLYDIRNSIVHEGATFASLGLSGEKQCESMLGLLASCIITLLEGGFATRLEADEFAYSILTASSTAPILSARSWKHATLPLSLDKSLKKRMTVVGSSSMP